MIYKEEFFKDVEKKIKSKNKILFSADSRCLKNLIENVESQNHRVIIMWTFDCAESIIESFEKNYPGEKRPAVALEKSRLWSEGIIKMPEAKKAILDVHALAKEISVDSAAANCHAVAQGCSTVHTQKHAMGLVYYELTSIVLACKGIKYQRPVEDKIEWYMKRLSYWKDNTNLLNIHWANFI